MFKWLFNFIKRELILAIFYCVAWMICLIFAFIYAVFYIILRWMLSSVYGNRLDEWFKSNFISKPFMYFVKLLEKFSKELLTRHCADKEDEIF